MPLNFPYPYPKWLDGDYTVATPVSLPVFSSPIPATTAEYVFTQDFIQLRNNFAPLTLNTRHFDPKYNDYFLVSESPRTDQGGGVVRWTRTYSQVPDTYDEFESYVLNTIGFAAGGDANSPNSPGRNRESYAVPSRLRYEFFITDHTGRVTNPPDGRVYRSPGSILLLQPLSYWLVDQQFPARNPTPWTVDVIEDSPPFNQPTSPRLTSYRTWINNALAEGFDGDTINGFDPEGDNPSTTDTWHSLNSPSQFPVEQSSLKRWQGNIWVRITRTVLAR